jgi:hypothetical protein
MNAFHSSDEETEPSDADVSSNEEFKEVDPFEDDEFCLRELLSGWASTNGNEIIKEREGKLDIPNESKMDLAENIGRSQVGDESDCSSSNLPIIRYKKKRKKG